MPTRTRSLADVDSEGEPRPKSGIFVCGTCPGRSVFLEAGNTDGWISTDVTADVTR